MAPHEVVQRLVSTQEHHATAEKAREIFFLRRQWTPSAECLWSQLESGEALSPRRRSCHANDTASKNSGWSLSA
eukprot:scaffold194303_cov35-Tisochrysis_lutea.AAC.1